MPIIRYQDVLSDLRVAYDRDAADRDVLEKTFWKVAEREAFLKQLQVAGCGRLLEIGAGTGQDSAYFMDHGLDVVAVDLSPAMVQRCRAKGIEAHVMDSLSLDFAPGSFDAAYALNCLLHVPNADLPSVLRGIATVLAPGGLFFLGVYGGGGSEGIAEQDSYDPPRFFSWRTDEQIQQFALRDFDILDFHVIEQDDICFQSLTLRRPG
ncbi:MAG TPA: SAM-dependent methyltransferase [Micromonosporaceae bacterium]|nr:SAM-dependent methyltransferase [Micromonosporaceae bacterium]HCU51398.1 SAM-dependent methyltransferase [Micromonosporaceae bacterium]